MQLELLKGEFEHSVIRKIKYISVKHVRGRSLNLNVLRLAFIFARRSIKTQDVSCFGFKNCLTEASLRWNFLENIKKVDNLVHLAISMLKIFDLK